MAPDLPGWLWMSFLRIRCFTVCSMFGLRCWQNNHVGSVIYCKKGKDGCFRGTALQLDLFPTDSFTNHTPFSPAAMSCRSSLAGPASTGALIKTRDTTETSIMTEYASVVFAGWCSCCIYSINTVETNPDKYSVRLMLVYCWPSVEDIGPTLNQHRVNIWVW